MLKILAIKYSFKLEGYMLENPNLQTKFMAQLKEIRYNSN